MNLKEMYAKRLERKKQRIMEKEEKNYLLLVKAFKKEIIKDYNFYELKHYISLFCYAETKYISKWEYKKILGKFEFYDFDHEKFQRMLRDAIQSSLSVKCKMLTTRFDNEEKLFSVRIEFHKL